MRTRRYLHSLLSLFVLFSCPATTNDCIVVGRPAQRQGGTVQLMQVEDTVKSWPTVQRNTRIKALVADANGEWATRDSWVQGLGWSNDRESGEDTTVQGGMEGTGRSRQVTYSPLMQRMAQCDKPDGLIDQHCEWFSEVFHGSIARAIASQIETSLDQREARSQGNVWRLWRRSSINTYFNYRRTSENLLVRW